MEDISKLDFFGMKKMSTELTSRVVNLICNNLDAKPRGVLLLERWVKQIVLSQIVETFLSPSSMQRGLQD